MSGRIWVCPGARATEAELLGAVSRACRVDEGRLPRVLIVVPSAGLRRHLLATLARELGPALLGVEVSTAFALALRVCERAGVAPRLEPPLFALLAQQAARRERALSRRLAALEDGFSCVAGSAGDLASACLESGQLSALEEALAEGGDDEEAARALALARVALAAQARSSARSLLRTTDVYGRAAGVLAGGAELPGHPATLLLHGYGDATGQTTQLLAELLRRGATMLVDRPPDPRAPRQRRPDADDYTAPLCGSLAVLTGAPVEQRGVVASAPTLALFTAAGRDAEVREAVRRAQAAIDAGVEPERVAIVARQLEGYAQPLRSVCRELGLPAAGIPNPPQLHPRQRRFRASLELLRGAASTSVDRWLLALGHPAFDRERPGPATARKSGGEGKEGAAPPGPAPRRGADAVALALRALGALRLRDVAALDAEAVLAGAETFALPVRRGLEVDEDEGGRAWARAERQQLAGDALRDAVARAAELVEAIDAAPRRQSLADAARWSTSVACHHLRWPAEVWEALVAPLLPLGAEPQVDRGEFVSVLAELGAELGVEPDPSASAARGGVRVLDAGQARGQTFTQLFVLGCNRGSFPRQVREDPLLPDSLRRRLQPLLPDLRLKLHGVAEERHLFAQLLSSAERVTLSWQRADDDGRLRLPSPLVERLRFGDDPLPAPRRLPRLRGESLRPPFAGGEGRPRSPREWSLLLGLAGRRAELAGAWTAVEEQGIAELTGARSDAAVEPSPSDAAVEPSPSSPPGDAVAAACAARLAILAEQDPAPGTIAGAGPYLGLVGPLSGAGDPRRAALYVTTLEDLARCPWRAFLVDLLRLTAAPDPRAALPAIDPPLVGEVVHRCLELLVAPAGRVRPGGATQEVERSVSRPSSERVEAAVAECAEAVAVARGLRWPGLRRALAERVRPLVERAVSLDWPHAQAQVRVVGAELPRSLAFRDGEGRPRRVRFKVDRIDRHGEALVLTDYKTGRPPSLGKRAETRRRQLRDAVQRGERLQVAAYAGSAEGAVGRYLFVDPQLPEALAVARLDRADPAVQRALPRVLRGLTEAWEGGVFPPRLEDPRGDEPRACRRCPVAEACSRGDSGQRARLRTLAARARDGGGDDLGDAAGILGWLFGLGERRERRG